MKIWLMAIATLGLAGCTKQVTYDAFDATRVNASNALDGAARANSRLDDVESGVEEMDDRIQAAEAKAQALEERLDVICSRAPQVCY